MASLIDIKLLEAKIDLVRSSINTLTNMNDQQFIDSDYFNTIIMMNGGSWFAEGISILRGNPRKLVEKEVTVLDHQGNEITITIMAESDNPADVLPVTRIECLNHMKNAISILLAVRWSLESI